MASGSLAFFFAPTAEDPGISDLVPKTGPKTRSWGAPRAECGPGGSMLRTKTPVTCARPWLRVRSSTAVLAAAGGLIRVTKDSYPAGGLVLRRPAGPTDSPPRDRDDSHNGPTRAACGGSRNLKCRMCFGMK